MIRLRMQYYEMEEIPMSVKVAITLKGCQK